MNYSAYSGQSLSDRDSFMYASIESIVGQYFPCPGTSMLKTLV